MISIVGASVQAGDFLNDERCVSIYAILHCRITHRGEAAIGAEHAMITRRNGERLLLLYIYVCVVFFFIYNTRTATVYSDFDGRD